MWTKVMSILGGGVVESIGDTIKKFVTTDGDRIQLQKELETILQKRDSEIEQTIRAELAAKKDIMVAELQHGDTYTKRARPTVVYMGLACIVFNYCFVPTVQTLLDVKVDPFMLPDAFWMAWGGVVSVYSLGRSAEKRGTRNKVTDFMTGSGLAKILK